MASYRPRVLIAHPDQGTPPDVDWERNASLAAETTVRLVGDSFARDGTHRLPTLAVKAALRVGGAFVVEVEAEPAHEWLKEQPPGPGPCTVYQARSDRVTSDDLIHAAQWVCEWNPHVGHYVFLIAGAIDPALVRRAAELSAECEVEFAVIDCLGFLRHFLHFFHRRRTAFLDAYQSLLLDEPESSVGQPLKEAFLASRRAALAGIAE